MRGSPICLEELQVLLFCSNTRQDGGMRKVRWGVKSGPGVKVLVCHVKESGSCPGKEEPWQGLKQSRTIVRSTLEDVLAKTEGWQSRGAGRYSRSCNEKTVPCRLGWE